MQDLFIFSEVVHCGRIGRIAFESFRRHHPGTKVHVFGLPDDFTALNGLEDTCIFHPLTDPPTTIFQRLFQTLNPKSNTRIARNFSRGHLGTASLWAKLIQERPERYFFHFDTDVVFRGEVLSDIAHALKEGSSLVGPARPYKYNLNNRDDVRHLPDVTQTYCFAFDRTKISPRSYRTLTKMCQGRYNPFRQPVIDFFDPVSFDIIHNSGRVSFLGHNAYGGCDQKGSRENTYAAINAFMDFGDKIAHFSAVGSGMNYYEHPETIRGVPASYRDYAIERYALYAKLFFKEELAIPLDHKKYHPLLSIPDWY